MTYVIVYRPDDGAVGAVIQATDYPLDKHPLQPGEAIVAIDDEDWPVGLPATADGVRYRDGVIEAKGRR